MTRIAVITGATSGIGYEFAKVLSEDDSFDSLWLIGRRTEKLDFAKGVAVKADLSTKEGLDIIAGKLSEDKPVIGLLINCAGLGFKGDLSDSSREQISSVIDVNCRALSGMISICLPYMEDGRSGIINIASSAGFLPQPKFAVYAASKSYVISLSRALHYELRPRHIQVTCICPGPVITDFIPRSSGGDTELTGIKKLTAKKPDEVAARSLAAYKRGRKVYSCGISQKLLRLASKIIPLDWILMTIKW